MNKIKYLMVLFLVLFVGNTNAEECSSTPADGCEVSENTTFNLDTYNLPNGIRFNTSNIFLDCNGATVIGNYTGYGITSGNFNNIQIKNCNIENYNIGIALTRSSNDNVYYNTLRNNYYGIYIYRSSSDNIYNNNFENNTRSIYFYTYTHPSYYNAIYSNDFNSGTYGIDAECYSYYPSKYCPRYNTIKNNSFTNLDYGVYLSDLDLPTYFNITQNEFSNNNIHDLYLGTQKNTIWNNVFDGAGVRTKYTSNKYCYDGIENSYIGDTFGQTCDCWIPEVGGLTADTKADICYGTYTNVTIYLTGTNSSIDCHNSTLIGQGTTSGIRTLGSTNNAEIKNCNIEDYDIGIALTGSYNNHIFSNTIKNNNYGVYFYRSSYNNIYNNNLENNDKAIYIYQYRVYNSDHNSIYSNKFNNGTYGLQTDCYAYEFYINCPLYYTIKDNNFTNLDYGIDLRWSNTPTYFNITKNNFYRIGRGIYLGTDNNNILSNIFNYNNYSLYNRGCNHSITDNQLINSINYSFYHQNSCNQSAEYNYWGTNSASIISKSIYDYYDNPSYGIVYFEPFLTEVEHCNNGIKDDDETGIDCGGSCPNACTESLLEKYAPVLYFHPDEQFFPTTIDAMLNESDLKKDNLIFDDLIDEMPVAESSLSLSDVNNYYYLDMRNASGGFKPLGTVPNSVRFNKYLNNVYGRITKPDNKHIVLQYWFFYSYNNWENGHEGDWEMIQIILNKTTEEPIIASYSIHLGGQKHDWNDILKNETHPKVFITKGGHGNWANPGNNSFGFGIFNIELLCPLFIDETSDDGKILSSKDYSLIEINDNTSWVGFKGKWGEIGTLSTLGTSGSDSPKNRNFGKIWNEPSEWGYNPNLPVFIACTGSPVNLHVYDSQGNHVGLNEEAGIETEIPNTYLYIPSDDDKEMVVIPTSEDLSFVITGTSQGKFNLSIGRNEKNSSNQIIIKYNDIEITNQTIATVNTTPTNPNFIMQIDKDGDGIVDTTATPDNVTIEGNSTNTEIDSDNDGYSNSIDNCPTLYNPNQITDFDGDGFDNLLCDGQDCNDNNHLINPDTNETCNNIDDNCNNQIDEDLNITFGTDIGACEFGIETCIEGGYVITKPSVDPIDEICDSIDNDCDNEMDEVDDDNDDFNDCNGEDLCLNTISDNFLELKKNHFAGNWNGCSCTDILECKPGNDEGELKYGCTQGTIDIWLEKRGWAQSCNK